MRMWRRRRHAVNKEEGEQMMLDIFSSDKMDEVERRELEEDIAQLKEIFSMKKHPSYKRPEGES
jgi:hypothetical protein